MKFRRLNSEPRIYVKENKLKEIICILMVYVDDILLTGKEKVIINNKEQIKINYNIKYIGEVNFVIGIKFEKQSDVYIIYQRGYLRELLNKFRLTNCTPVRNMKPLENKELRHKKFNETFYRSATSGTSYT